MASDSAYVLAVATTFALAKGCLTFLPTVTAYFLSASILAGGLLTLAFLYTRPDDSRVVPNDFTVGIVGAGFSGIAMAIKLQKIGIKYTLYERDKEIGGTWRANAYPGCACDVPSHLYSLSTDPNPGWSLHYSERAEILDYLKAVAEKHQLNIRTNAECVSHAWDEERHIYKTTFADGSVAHNNVVIAGPGPFWYANIPKFPGLDSFKGPSFHSLNWDTNYDYRRKRLAVIGTGASAVQIVPNVSDDVDKLYVFQRTPCWVPRKIQFSHPHWLIWIFKNVPGFQQLYRFILFIVFDARYWLVFRKESRLAKLVQGLVENDMRSTINNDGLAKKLIPKLEMGCKRITPSNSYLQAFSKPNVELITEPIDHVVEDGVVSKDGRKYEVDAIVFATGFDMLRSVAGVGELTNGDTGFLETMGDRPFLHMNVAAESYPNFFYLLGPHSGIGHHSAVFLIECEVEYIAQCLRHMIKIGSSAMQVRSSALRRYKEFVDRELDHTVFVTGCNSYYKTRGGGGEVFALWPCSCLKFWRTLRRMRPEEYVWTRKG